MHLVLRLWVPDDQSIIQHPTTNKFMYRFLLDRYESKELFELIQKALQLQWCWCPCLYEEKAMS